MKKVLTTLFALLVFVGFTSGQPERRLKAYSIEQATSENAQLHTVAFSGLAFLTGNFGADTFFPPGKVADYFGFQFMRDNDKNQSGHQTDFLTRIANNVIALLSEEQLNRLIELGKEQAPLYDAFAKERLVLIKAFRTAMETGVALDSSKITAYGRTLYQTDADLSYGRALVVGSILHSLTDAQRKTLSNWKFDDSGTWPVIPENLDKQRMSHRAHVAVMTYASELFSWYAGSLTADVYFCPERHGTYFGGFYLKDFPAMGKPAYAISTALTGDSGRDFLMLSSSQQRLWMDECMSANRPLLTQIVSLRERICRELRKAMNAEFPDKTAVTEWIQQYGALDAEMSLHQAVVYGKIFRTLTPDQKKALNDLRNQSELPTGYYVYSDLVNEPIQLDCTELLSK